MPLFRGIFRFDRTSRGDGALLRGLLCLAAVLLCALIFPLKGTSQPQSVQSLIDQGQTAGADGELMRTVAQRAEAAGLRSEATADLLRPAVTLAKQDLPTAPLLTKTLEGLSKRVPPARMAPVLQQLQGHTEQAGRLVSEWTGRGDVQALTGDGEEGSGRGPQDVLTTSIAEAQAQGIPLDHVRQFLEGLPQAVERRPVPLSEVASAVNVMPDLPGASETHGAAHRLLTAALDAGYDAESMRQLPVALERAHRESQRPPAVLARGAAQAIAGGAPAGAVLKSLFQGGVPGAGPPEGVPGEPPGQGKPPGPGDQPQPPGTGPPDEPPGGPPDEPPGGPPDAPPGGGGGNGA